MLPPMSGECPVHTKAGPSKIHRITILELSSASLSMNIEGMA
jgi:hypothetical protein